MTCFVLLPRLARKACTLAGRRTLKSPSQWRQQQPLSFAAQLERPSSPSSSSSSPLLANNENGGTTYCSSPSCSRRRAPVSDVCRRFLSTEQSGKDMEQPEQQQKQQQQQRDSSSSSLDDVVTSEVSPQDAKLAMEASAADTSTNDETGGTIHNLPGTGNKDKKVLAIVFTCTVCNTRAAKQFTEQAYKHGVVLVKCPGCNNLHLIADRLGVFQDDNVQGGDGNKGWDIEKAMASIGEHVKAVNNDNVLELTIQDVVGQEAIEQAKALNDDKQKGR